MQMLLYAGHEFRPPVPKGNLSKEELRMRNTILIAEHGSEKIVTEGGTFRILKDGNHKIGALGNLVLLTSYSPDYNGHGKGWKVVEIADASTIEKREAKRLSESYGLPMPSVVTRLGLSREGGRIKYWSYFVFNVADSPADFNLYFKQRFPNANDGPNTASNIAAIKKYGGNDSYYTFFKSVYNSFKEQVV